MPRAATDRHRRDASPRHADGRWRQRTPSPRRCLHALDGACAPADQLREGGGLPDGLLYVSLAGGQRQARVPAAPPMRVVHYLAAKQRQDGSWEGVGGSRAPMQDGNFSRTALEHSRADRLCHARASRRIHRARAARCRVAGRPAAAQHRGSGDAAAGPALGRGRTEAARRHACASCWRCSAPTAAGRRHRICRATRMPPDRCCSACASSACRQRRARYSAALRYLQRTQAEDGTWHVVNRAMKLQPYFEGGFPYGTTSGSRTPARAWAVMGLASAGLDAAPASAAR